MSGQKKLEWQDYILEDIKGTAYDIYDQMNQAVPIYNKIITKDLIFSIYKSLLFSIQKIDNVDFFQYLAFLDEEKKEKRLMNLFDDMINIKKENFSSKNLFLRTEYKHKYYERVLKIRIKIQMEDWNYRNLAKDINSFLQTREILKIMFNKLSTMDKKKKDYIQCPECSTKWLTKETDNCPRCDQSEKLTLYLRFCNVMHVVGDMDKFYKQLDPATFKIIEDNWKLISQYFKNMEIKRANVSLLKMKKKYGMPQYNNIIKISGGVDFLPENYIVFNKKYNVAIMPNSIELNLRDATNTENGVFISDLNELEFKLCEKLLLPPRKIIFNDIKPKMPILMYLDATDCNISKVNIEPKNFPFLETIILDRNPLKKYEDIEILTKIETLREISVNNTIMEAEREVYEVEKKLNKFKITLSYNYYLMGKLPHTIETEMAGEIDDKVKFLKRKHMTFEQSPVGSEVDDENESSSNFL